MTLSKWIRRPAFNWPTTFWQAVARMHEGVGQLGGLPDGARKLAEEVFFGTEGVGERYGKVPELLNALSAQGSTVEQHFGDLV